MIRIVHFSDWHCQFRDLPWADIYVCTGDMLGNYPKLKQVNDRNDCFNGWFERKINHEKEKMMQEQWFYKKFAKGNKSLRKFFKSKNAPVVVVRGNHDFTSLAPMFGGEVFEINEPTDTVEYCGLKFGGFRGINYIVGEWSDEFQDHELRNIIKKVPRDLDVICSHTPPLGIMDTAYGEHYGATGFQSYINDCMYEDGNKMPKLFCFGHTHACNGFDTRIEGTLFSNAATTYKVIDI